MKIYVILVAVVVGVLISILYDSQFFADLFPVHWVRRVAIVILYTLILTPLMIFASKARQPKQP